MITVTYAPNDSGSIGPNGEKELIFYTHADFRDWVKWYVCDECRSRGDGSNTIGDYLSSGCGCEIAIHDPHDKIFWDDIILSDDIINKYL